MKHPIISSEDNDYEYHEFKDGKWTKHNQEKQFIKKLTDNEIMEAFRDEAKELLPGLIASQEESLRPIKEKLREIANMAVDDLAKTIITEYMLNSEVRKQIEILHKNKKYLKMLTQKIPTGRITDEQIAKAKDIPIQELYDFQKARTRGKRISASCPFHEDNTPSFHIYENNTFYCFSCNAKGSAIDFYMQLHNVNFVTAVKNMG